MSCVGRSRFSFQRLAHRLWLELLRTGHTSGTSGRWCMAGSSAVDEQIRGRIVAGGNGRRSSRRWWYCAGCSSASSNNLCASSSISYVLGYENWIQSRLYLQFCEKNHTFLVLEIRIVYDKKPDENIYHVLWNWTEAEALFHSALWCPPAEARWKMSEHTPEAVWCGPKVCTLTICLQGRLLPQLYDFWTTVIIKDKRGQYVKHVSSKTKIKIYLKLPFAKEVLESEGI